MSNVIQTVFILVYTAFLDPMMMYSNLFLGSGREWMAGVPDSHEGVAQEAGGPETVHSHLQWV